jgi:hypothetical protein
MVIAMGLLSAEVCEVGKTFAEYKRQAQQPDMGAAEVNLIKCLLEV